MEDFISPCGELRGRVASFARHVMGFLVRQILSKIMNYPEFLESILLKMSEIIGIILRRHLGAAQGSFPE
jgi:hypothetical protein